MYCTGLPLVLYVVVVVEILSLWAEEDNRSPDAVEQHIVCLSSLSTAGILQLLSRVLIHRLPGAKE